MIPTPPKGQPDQWWIGVALHVDRPAVLLQQGPYQRLMVRELPVKTFSTWSFDERAARGAFATVWMAAPKRMLPEEAFRVLNAPAQPWLATPCEEGSNG